MMFAETIRGPVSSRGPSSQFGFGWIFVFLSSGNTRASQSHQELVGICDIGNYFRNARYPISRAVICYCDSTTNVGVLSASGI